MSRLIWLSCRKKHLGPVALIITFKTLEEAVEIANSTPYGLAAYFLTNNYKTGTYLHDHLDFEIIGWNDGAHLVLISHLEV